MKLIATANFQPEGVPRPVRAGEAIVVPAGLARKWIAQGLAKEAEPEQAIRKPRENAARRVNR